MFVVVFTTGCDNDIAPSEIPSVVENTFKSHFPDATEVEWESYGENFEVDFEVDQTDHSARIDNAGNMLEYKYKIARNILPPPVINVLNMEYVKKKYQKQPVNTVDGVRIEYDKEWVHLRKSNTEPIIRIYSESQSRTTADNLAKKIMADISEVVRKSR